MSLVATTDVLFVVRRLGEMIGAVTDGEIYLYAYLSCWLFTYRSNDPREWGYLFTATATGAPYSRELDEAIEHLISSGQLIEGDTGLSLTDTGQEELGLLSVLSGPAGHRNYLEAACSTILALPTGVVRGALATDADIVAARDARSPREMFTVEALIGLRNDFDILENSLGRSASDLLSAATVWATYMNEQSSRLPD